MERDMFEERRHEDHQGNNIDGDLCLRPSVVFNPSSLVTIVTSQWQISRGTVSGCPECPGILLEGFWEQPGRLLRLTDPDPQ